MKKIIALCAVAVISATSVFAEKKVVQSLNLSIPIESQTWTDEDDNDLKFKSTSFDINWNKMTVKDSGYSFIFGLGVGYDKGTLKDLVSYGGQSGDLDMKGVDMNLKLGWGGTPLNTDKFILAIHGILGFDFKALFNSEEYGIDVYGTEFSLTEIDRSAFDFSMIIGADVAFVAKVGDSFGIFAGIDFSTNIFGVGTIVQNVTTPMGTADSSAGFSYVFKGFSVVPRVGICWVL